jgi:hypothetical protein
VGFYIDTDKTAATGRRFCVYGGSVIASEASVIASEASVIASEAKQSTGTGLLRRFAPRNDNASASLHVYIDNPSRLT